MAFGLAQLVGAAEAKFGGASGAQHLSQATRVTGVAFDQEYLNWLARHGAPLCGFSAFVQVCTELKLLFLASGRKGVPAGQVSYKSQSDCSQCVRRVKGSGGRWRGYLTAFPPDLQAFFHAFFHNTECARLPTESDIGGSARSAAPWARRAAYRSRYRPDGGARSSARHRAASLPTGRSSRWYAGWRREPGTWSRGSPWIDRSGRCRSPRWDRACGPRNSHPEGRDRKSVV